VENDIHVLDRPVWHALTGRQSDLSQGNHRALRIAPDYGPFAAAADASAANLAALAGLAGGGEIWLVEKAAVVVPSGMKMARSAEVLQMIAASIIACDKEPDFHDLSDDDAPEMLALATLTVPGPFARRTNRLGGFVGIRQNGHLIAMAGERMKPGRFTEVSGVCTHPDHRGKGYAGMLMRIVAARILARGEAPFLHCYASNAGAIALYESLGFAAHQPVTSTVLAPA
jgi:predicted GNAT family acetyltransferase